MKLCVAKTKTSTEDYIPQTNLFLSNFSSILILLLSSLQYSYNSKEVKIHDFEIGMLTLIHCFIPNSKGILEYFTMAV